MKINILTLFPEMFVPVAESSIIGKACQKGLIEINVLNIRDYSQHKNKSVDDYPFGGGVGMVLTCDPIFNCISSLGEPKGQMIYMSPRGKILDLDLINEFKSIEEITILCGHYEGVDQRVLEHYNMKEVSIGDYILTGGELPAMVLIDSLARFVDGVLGDAHSAIDESVYSGLLEYPQYTKPREVAGMEVPEVLVSGNHKLIDLWKYEKSLELTLKNRPDLFQAYINKEKTLSKEQQEILKKVCKFCDL